MTFWDIAVEKENLKAKESYSKMVESIIETDIVPGSTEPVDNLAILAGGIMKSHLSPMHDVLRVFFW
jgi:hypothetical protein